MRAPLSTSEAEAGGGGGERLRAQKPKVQSSDDEYDDHNRTG